jgi:hypothetical protein
MRRGGARERAGDDAVDRVDELLHDVAPLAIGSGSPMSFREVDAGPGIRFDLFGEVTRLETRSTLPNIVSSQRTIARAARQGGNALAAGPWT